jgi:hypothetical protein
LGISPLFDPQHHSAPVDPSILIFAEIAGYGLSTDAYRVTDPDPEGATCVSAMRAAIDRAGVAPKEIDLVNAHGTSTQSNDTTETLALKNLFGRSWRRIPVHSIKSMIGHARRGLSELIASIQTLREGSSLRSIKKPGSNAISITFRTSPGNKRSRILEFFGFEGRTSHWWSRNMLGEHDLVLILVTLSLLLVVYAFEKMIMTTTKIFLDLQIQLPLRALTFPAIG